MVILLLHSLMRCLELGFWVVRGFRVSSSIRRLVPATAAVRLCIADIEWNYRKLARRLLEPTLNSNSIRLTRGQLERGRTFSDLPPQRCTECVTANLNCTGVGYCSSAVGLSVCVCVCVVEVKAVVSCRMVLTEFLLLVRLRRHHVSCTHCLVVLSASFTKQKSSLMLCARVRMSRNKS